jgi:hypothetical protein
MLSLWSCNFTERRQTSSDWSPNYPLLPHWEPRFLHRWKLDQKTFPETHCSAFHGSLRVWVAVVWFRLWKHAEKHSRNTRELTCSSRSLQKIVMSAWHTGGSPGEWAAVWRQSSSEKRREHLNRWLCSIGFKSNLPSDFVLLKSLKMSVKCQESI